MREPLRDIEIQEHTDFHKNKLLTQGVCKKAPERFVGKFALLAHDYHFGIYWTKSNHRYGDILGYSRPQPEFKRLANDMCERVEELMKFQPIGKKVNVEGSGAAEIPAKASNSFKTLRSLLGGCIHTGGGDKTSYGLLKGIPVDLSLKVEKEVVVENGAAAHPEENEFY